MKLPRDVAAKDLISLLRSMGYEAMRQRGSHVRMRHLGPPPHMMTIPWDSPLKVGTLHAILSEVAKARSVPMETLISRL